MFLSVAPLEQLADAELGIDSSLRAEAYAYAASWRHGMAGNSPLYMPGFFAVAVGAWIWSETGSGRRQRAIVHAAGVLIAAIAVASIASSFQAPIVVSEFGGLAGFSTHPPVPAPTLHALGVGLYTLLTWSAFVIGSRVALSRRSLVPLIPVPVLTAGLIAIRPWTVDDFTAMWAHRTLEGDPAALGSLVAIPVVAALLVRRGYAGSSRVADHADYTDL
jgi:hypothetical protein